MALAGIDSAEQVQEARGIASVYADGDSGEVMRIYTKTGDDGTTGLIGGDRVAKIDLRIEALGAIDELNALIGIAALTLEGSELYAKLIALQSRLFDVGAEVATPMDNQYFRPATMDEDVLSMEHDIDLWFSEMEPLRNFILPGGTMGSAQLHLCRTVCRRAERTLLTLQTEAEVRSELLAYLNRLSDWFFAAARYANHLAGVADVKWEGRASS